MKVLEKIPKKLEKLEKILKKLEFFFGKGPWKRKLNVTLSANAQILPEFGLSAPPVGPYAHLREFLS